MIVFYQVDEEHEAANGRVVIQPIAKVLIGNGLNAKGALILAREIAEDPSDVPNIPDVVDMRNAKPVPVFTMGIDGPDGFHKTPDGLDEYMDCLD
jgi:hypothetical protein